VSHRCLASVIPSKIQFPGWQSHSVRGIRQCWWPLQEGGPKRMQNKSDQRCDSTGKEWMHEPHATLLFTWPWLSPNARNRLEIWGNKFALWQSQLSIVPLCGGEKVKQTLAEASQAYGPRWAYTKMQRKSEKRETKSGSISVLGTLHHLTLKCHLWPGSATNGHRFLPQGIWLSNLIFLMGTTSKRPTPSKKRNYKICKCI
jgi:hypothetical protein